MWNRGVGALLGRFSKFFAGGVDGGSRSALACPTGALRGVGCPSAARERSSGGGDPRSADPPGRAAALHVDQRMSVAAVASGVPLVTGVALPSVMLSHILILQTDLALPGDVGVRLFGDGHDAEA